MNSMYNGFGLRLSWNNLAYKTQKAYSLFKTRVPQEQKERTGEFVKMSGDIWKGKAAKIIVIKKVCKCWFFTSHVA